MVKILEKLFFDPQLGFVLRFKIYNLKIPKFLKLLIRKSIFKKYGVLIGKNTHFGRNVKFVHPTGIVIGDSAIIGDNVSIYQNVTLGLANSKKNKKDGYPIIDNDVTIYANSVIVGPIKIGEGAIIGANSFINKDIGPWDTVVGNPARKIQ